MLFTLLVLIVIIVIAVIIMAGVIIWRNVKLPTWLPTSERDTFYQETPEINHSGLVIMSSGDIINGQYIRISKDQKDCMHLAEVQVWDPDRTINYALHKDVTMSSYWGPPYNASNIVNDNTGLEDIAHTSCEEPPWIEINLGKSVDIGYIVLMNRPDCCQWRLIGAVVEVLDRNKQQVFISEKVKTSGAIQTLFLPNTAFSMGDPNNLDITGDWPAAILTKTNGKWKPHIHRPDFQIIPLGNNEFGFRFPDDKKPYNAKASNAKDGVARKLDFGKNYNWIR